MLRNRYGQKRERVDENQLFMFAAQIASTGQEPPPEPKPAAAEPRPPPGHGRQPLPSMRRHSGSGSQAPESSGRIAHMKPQFVRIENYTINLANVTYLEDEKNGEAGLTIHFVNGTHLPISSAAVSPLRRFLHDSGDVKDLRSPESDADVNKGRVEPLKSSGKYDL